MQSVRDFRDVMVGRLGGEHELDRFLGRSEAWRNFLEKLNRLGGRRIQEFPPETTWNIDATVALSDEEWCSLTRELDELIAPA